MSTGTKSRVWESQAGWTTRANILVWAGLVAITGSEVFFAREGLRPALMLGVLASLSVAQAALIVSYFMRLKFEKIHLALWLIPAVIFCAGMMMIFFFPDGFRLLQMRR